MRRILIAVLLAALATVGVSAQATKIQSSGTLPANCTVGNIYLKTGGSAGLYVCLATNTWSGPLATSSGTVTTTGSPASGNLAKFSGASSITNGDLSGDVTTSGTLATTIANDAVTFAKMQNVAANSVPARAANSSGDLSEVALSASQLLGRGSTGDIAAIAVGTGLSMSGTTLSATGAGATVGDLLDFKFIKKASNETVASSTTLQDDDDFTLAIGANDVWVIEYWLFIYSNSNAGGFKYSISMPTGSSVYDAQDNVIFSANSSTGDIDRFAGTGVTTPNVYVAGMTSGAIRNLVRYPLVIVNSSTAGNVKLRWAQRVSDANGAVLQANSIMMARRFN